MGFFDGLFNTITQPLGIKLFSGGPYPDAGLGDQMGANAQQYMQQLAPIIAEIAEAAGIINPMNGQAPGNYNPDPYSLNPLQSASLNNELSIDEAGYNQLWKDIEADLNKRGLSDSATKTAAKAYLDQQLQAQMGATRVQAGQNAYANRMTAFQQIAQLLGQGFGAKQGATQTQAGIAMDKNQQSMQQIGNLLALGMYAGGIGPFGARGPASAPAGGGGGGGFNPNITGTWTGQSAAGPGMVTPDWGSLFSNFGSIYGT